MLCLVELSIGKYYSGIADVDDEDDSDTGPISPFMALYNFDDDDDEDDEYDEDGVLMRRASGGGAAKVEGVNALGELVRSDGTVIGHKHYVSIYKQQRTLAMRRAADEYSEKTIEQLIAEAHNPLRALKRQAREMAAKKKKHKIDKETMKRRHDDDTKMISYQMRSHKTNNDHMRSQNPMLN